MTGRVSSVLTLVGLCFFTVSAVFKFRIGRCRAS